ncbi:hypothetical protein DESA109040_20480 [Deinococcus saxicola]|uniref:hypothetical protein n=1 Tax=Deinococcus saxicola TaxID=249406 RepID=UPI0039F0DA73
MIAYVRGYAPDAPHVRHVGYDSSLLPDGKTLLYLALGTDLPVEVNTVTGAVRDMGTRLGVYPFFTAAIGNDGTIWFTDINNNLNRRDPDGRVSTVISTVTLPGPENLIVTGLDAATPGVLWLQKGFKAIRLETSSMNMTPTTVGRISRMITTRNGGVAVVTYDGCGTQACFHHTRPRLSDDLEGFPGSTLGEGRNFVPMAREPSIFPAPSFAETNVPTRTRSISTIRLPRGPEPSGP